MARSERRDSDRRPQGRDVAGPKTKQKCVAAKMATLTGKGGRGPRNVREDPTNTRGHEQEV